MFLLNPDAALSGGSIEKALIFTVFLLFLIHKPAAKRYDLPLAWMGNNTRNLTQINLPGAGLYRILKAPANADITSDNGTFALAFLDLNNTGKFYLSVVLQSETSAVPVWIANRNQTVGEGSYLLLTPQNSKLLLIDPAFLNQQPVWATPPTGIGGIELLESGNFRFYNGKGHVLDWQSFDSPADVLLPSQVLRPGMELWSRVNESSFEYGMYSGVLGPGGFMLNVNVQRLQPQQYHVWSLNGKKCQPVLNFTAGGVYQQCGSSVIPIAPLEIDEQTVLPPFLRLDSDGDFVVHRYNEHVWIPEFRLSDLQHDTCKLPDACGPYGICQQDGKCSCMEVPRGGAEVYRAVPSAGRCPEAPPRGAPYGLPQPDECANEYVNHHFVNVSGVGYFALPFIQPDNRTSLQQCAAACRWNCSCAALFFDNRTGDCFFVIDQLLGSLTFTPSSKTVTAMLKFRNRNIYTGFLPLQSAPSQGGSGMGRTRKIILITLAAAAGFLIMALSVCVGLTRWRLMHRNLDDVEVDEMLSGMQGLPQRFSYAALESATRGFSHKLGSGGFGSVYEGFLVDGRAVAVKKLESGGSQGARQFIAEVATIGSISHVHVVKLCGFCVEKSHRMLVYEFISNGSLDRWLFNSESGEEIGDGERTPDQPRVLSWQRRVDIALGTARGLAYLHEECREPIIHLDVKPQNILLDERFVAKVADFGMSKLLDGRDVSHVVTGVRGTPGYLAPEWLMHSIATKKCDVYSYGMVLMELIGGRRNIQVSRMSEDVSWYFPAWVVSQVKEGKVMEVVDERIRASAGEKQAGVMVRIALWCVQENAAFRPTMQEVVQMIEGHREVAEPPLSFHFAVQAMVDITASGEFGSMAYVSGPSLDLSSLIR